MIFNIYKTRRKAKNGVIQTGRIWRLRYRFGDMPKPLTVSLKTSDKRIAEKRANEFREEWEREHEGIGVPRREREAAQRDIPGHLDEYVSELTARGRVREYTRQVRSRVTRLCADCGWTRLRDVTAESFQAWRRQSGVSPRTQNHYLDAIWGLMEFLVRQGRVASNPLQYVERVDARGTGRKRRAYTDDELQRLLDVAGLRGVVYLAAVKTGLRLGELRALTWGDVRLVPGTASVRVQASTTKNRRDATLPVTPDLANALRAIRPDAWSPSGRVFANGMPSHHTLARHLKAAKIAKTDDRGRFVDFHAFRTTFISNLQRSGAHPRVVQELARHSDIRLTHGTYTDASVLELGKAVAALPEFTAAGAQIGAHELVADGLGVSHDDAENDCARRTETGSAQEKRRASARPVTDRHSVSNKWSRGESNPRVGTVSRTPLRV